MTTYTDVMRAKPQQQTSLAVKYINEAQTPGQRRARKNLMFPFLYSTPIKLGGRHAAKA